MGPAPFRFVALALGMFEIGCVTKECTLIGCLNQFSVQIARLDGSFPPGVHQVDVSVDGMPLSCSFTFPFATLPGGGTVGPNCSPGLTVAVYPAVSCTESSTGEARVRRCDPIPGQWTERIDINGTPAAVQIRQSVDGAVFFERATAPAYETSRPNGPDCEPLCRQATESWTLP